MRISDWSSDVCSSDLVAPGAGTAHRVVEQLGESDVAAALLEPGEAPKTGVVGVLKGPLCEGVVLSGAKLVVITEAELTRSEERREGKECVRPCISRGTPYH